MFRPNSPTDILWRTKLLQRFIQSKIAFYCENRMAGMSFQGENITPIDTVRTHDAKIFEDQVCDARD